MQGGVGVRRERQMGERAFTDGTTRAIFEDADGRQYVRGDEGEPVYGVWLPPSDEPIEVHSQPASPP